MHQTQRCHFFADKHWIRQRCKTLYFVRNNTVMKKIDYRNQALKILPWICGNCGRDFSGKKLRELTVHHKDHNHKNNPPDGSNWELLCLYCHDNEHSRILDSEWLPSHNSDNDRSPASYHTPFKNLNKLVSDKKNNEPE